MADMQELLNAIFDRPNNALRVSGSSGSVSTEDVQDIVGTMLLAGTKVTLTYDDTVGTLTIDVTAASTTDVSNAVATHAALDTDAHEGVGGTSKIALIHSHVASGVAQNIYVQGESNPPTGVNLGDVWIPAPDGIGL